MMMKKGLRLMKPFVRNVHRMIIEEAGNNYETARNALLLADQRMIIIPLRPSSKQCYTGC